MNWIEVCTNNMEEVDTLYFSKGQYQKEKRKNLKRKLFEEKNTPSSKGLRTISYDKPNEKWYF